jgi:hypothetical protein
MAFGLVNPAPVPPPLGLFGAVIGSDSGQAGYGESDLCGAPVGAEPCLRCLTLRPDQLGGQTHTPVLLGFSHSLPTMCTCEVF